MRKQWEEEGRTNICSGEVHVRMMIKGGGGGRRG